MIVTRDLLVAAGACQEALDWLDVQVPTLYGLKGIPFLQALNTAGKTTYVAWSRQVLRESQGILATGAAVRGGPVRITTPDGFELAANDDSATARIRQLKRERKAALAYAFSVNACTVLPNGDGSITPCDITQPTGPTADYFQAFDYQAGQYVRFPDYDGSVAFVKAKQAAYEASTAGVFVKEQKVYNADEPTIAAWAKL